MSAHLKEARRQLAIYNAKQPPVLTRVPREEWPERSFDPKRLEVWRSNKFLAQVFAEGEVLRVSVSRVVLSSGVRWQDGISWDELQQVKREIGRGDKWAVELYPADSDLVNVANMRHLWLLSDAPTFAWRQETSPGKAEEKKERRR